jgi:hypothetical protein
MPKPSKDIKQAGAVKRARGPAVAKDSSPDVAALLTRYGITTVSRPTYEWGGYRYTNAHDAIAAAKRGESA